MPLAMAGTSGSRQMRKFDTAGGGCFVIAATKRGRSPKTARASSRRAPADVVGRVVGYPPVEGCD